MNCTMKLCPIHKDQWFCPSNTTISPLLVVAVVVDAAPQLDVA